MPLAFTQVDAFTREPFRGNPAAICFDRATLTDEERQAIAREMNLSETAYVEPREGAFGLRWFTPTVEVNLCGHATLAAAHVLWTQERIGARERARFDTLSGRLEAERRDDGRIEMDFPRRPAVRTEAPKALANALGVTPVDYAEVGDDGIVLVEVGSEATVRSVTPDFSALRAFVRGVIVTARAEAVDVDFVSRFFAPAAGIDEDPVTGSAHCTLAPWWSGKLGRQELTGVQASKRGGDVYVRDGDERVTIGGYATTVIEGEIGAIAG